MVFVQQKDNEVLIADHYFLRREWQLGAKKKTKLTALNKEECEEHRNKKYLVQNSNDPTSQEDYITQVSEKNDG